MKPKFNVWDIVYVAYRKHKLLKVYKDTILWIRIFKGEPISYTFYEYTIDEGSIFSTSEKAVKFHNKQVKEFCKGIICNTHNDIYNLRKLLKEAEESLLSYNDMIKKNDFTWMITIS